ncbi:unnamed protein product [Dracunculus medinensis]|uniref:DH domain-containing protein n=1 Tax=Dracunculus medinensis TaxID=318479 RepID=A0A0N4U4N4_DRAME|nr:unnamed protein product [Dracunculus medinensis]
MVHSTAYNRIARRVENRLYELICFLIGPRKTSVVVCLSDLTKKLISLPVVEFSLPPNFINRRKKRIPRRISVSSTAQPKKKDTLSDNLQTKLAPVSPVKQASLVSACVESVTSKKLEMIDSVKSAMVDSNNENGDSLLSSKRPRRGKKTSIYSTKTRSKKESISVVSKSDDISSIIKKKRSARLWEKLEHLIHISNDLSEKSEKVEMHPPLIQETSSNEVDKSDDASIDDKRITAVVKDRSNCSWKDEEEFSEDIAVEIKCALDELISQISEQTEVNAKPCDLITEPLRLPEERRIVPPLRIRLPNKRQMRARKPARSKEYSPPGPSSRQKYLNSGGTVGVNQKQRFGTSLKECDETAFGDSNSQILSSSCSSEHNNSPNQELKTLFMTLPDYLGLSSWIHLTTLILSFVFLQLGTSSLAKVDCEESREKSFNKPGFETSLQNISSNKSDNSKLGCENSLQNIFSNDDIFTTESEDASIDLRMDFTSPVQQYEANAAVDFKLVDEGKETSTGRHLRPKSVTYKELFPELFSSRRRKASNSNQLPPKKVRENERKSEKCVEETVEHGTPQTSSTAEAHIGSTMIEILKDNALEEQDSLNLPVVSNHASSPFEHSQKMYRRDGSALERKRRMYNVNADTNNSPDDDDDNNIGQRRQHSKESHYEMFFDPLPPILLDSKDFCKEFEEMHAKASMNVGNVDFPKNVDQKLRTQCLQPVPYFKRIAQRRKLNPFAIGLKSRSSDNDSSIFYREILLRGEDLRKQNDAEIVVDGLLPQGDDDDVGTVNPALEIARSICRVIPRPTNTDDDGQSVELTVDDISNLIETESAERKELLQDLIKIIMSQYTSEIVSENVTGGASIQYDTMMKNCYRLRDRALLFTQERRDNVIWAHKSLIENLPINILATYINMLRFCKTMDRHLIDLILKKDSYDKIKSLIQPIRDFILSKVYDPQTIAISKTLSVSVTLKRRVDSICLIAVGPYINAGDYHPKIKSHDYLFRILLPNIVHYVEHVRLCLPISSEFSACEAADYAITLVCRKVNEVHKRFPSKKIVLVGWGLSGLINHQVVQCTSDISAIVNFAFPMKTVEGMRGDVDDDILLTYCPTLFIVGEKSTDCNIYELQRMASRMIAPAGVMLVGSANNNLQVSSLRLSTERFTQRTVQRALLDDIVDFFEKYCLGPLSNLNRQKPVALAETNDADMSLLKFTSSLFGQHCTSRKDSGARAARDRLKIDWQSSN